MGSQSTLAAATKEYNAEIMLISDLVLEMTRLCSFILSEIRVVEPTFCHEVGVLKVENATDRNNNDTVIEYEDTQKSDCPYPGLVAFLSERNTRRHVIDAKSNPDWLSQV